jgi:soluble lytic murein transglycosylase-like protein
MELNEPLVRMGSPPHSINYKKNSLFLFRFIRKVILFILIFLLSFYLPNIIPGIKFLPSGIQEKEKTIKEIRGILERYPTGLANGMKEELAEVIYEEATRFNQDPKFILALISIESSFQNWSVSERGAKGLMQIMPYVAQSLAQEIDIEWGGDRTLFNPFLNIRMGIYYLSQLVLDFDDIGIALAAYNCGPTYVKSLIEKKQRIPDDYYRKVLSVYQSL